MKSAKSRSLAAVGSCVAAVGVILGPDVLPATLAAQATPNSPSAVVSGVVRNRVTGEPMRLVVVRSADNNASTLSDDAGRYRLLLSLGEHRLDARRIGYKPASVPVTVAAGGTTLDISLDPIPVSLGRIVVTARDDFARRLVAAAIARKQRLRGSLHDYRYHGDVRFIIRNLDKPADSASSVRVITESQTEVYWEQPNKYQETILARRQTGNLPPERNLVGVGQILNVSRERVLFARFELASPIADDALGLYDYRVLDTLLVEGRRTYRLSVEPKPNGSPAFVGMMDIVDSTFDVVGIDVGVNKEVRLARARDVRYQQHFRQLEGGRWMPYSIELTATFDFSPFGRFTARHVATLSDFRFNEGQRPAGLGEYRIVVAPTADRIDSVTWSGIHLEPLPAVDSAGWKRLDSIANKPQSPVTRGINNALRFGLGGNPDFFHFNRVDGAYVGAGWNGFDSSRMPSTEPTLKLGYATGSTLWQYRIGDRVRLSDERRMWLGARYRDETENRPTLTSEGYNATTRALIATADPLDYYRERGFSASFTSRLMKFTDAEIGYTDARHSSLSNAIDRPPLRIGAGEVTRMRSNHQIDDGHLRALSATLAIDSRPMLKQGGRDRRLAATNFTRLQLDAEWSPGSMLSSDFDYRRATLAFLRQQESFGMGITRLVASAGVGGSGLPIQRAFAIDGGARVLESQASPFRTLGDSSFTGSRTGFFMVQHAFDRLLFTKSRLPLVRDIPFTLSVRAAAFWAEFPITGLDSAQAARRATFNVTRDPYREVGFTLGNLTPFVPLFNFSARFAWQLSRYPTTPFRFSLGLTR
jgi:hypothetical protein